MGTWLGLRSHEVLQGLADAPNTRSPFSAGSKQLFHLRRQNRGVQKRPAFVENRNVRLPASARCPFRHRVGDDHAHRALELWVGGQALDIEEQPVFVRLDGGGPVEKPRIHFIPRPFPQLHRGELRFVANSLHLGFIPPGFQFLPEIVEAGDRPVLSGSAALIRGYDGVGQQVVQNRGVGGRAVHPDHVPRQVLEERQFVVGWRRGSWWKVPRIQGFRALEIHVDAPASHQFHKGPIRIAAFQNRDERVEAGHHRQEHLHHERLATTRLRGNQHIGVAQAGVKRGKRNELPVRRLKQNQR